MPSTYNVPVINKTYLTSPKPKTGSRLYIENDWMYKPGSTSVSAVYHGLLCYNINSTTVSGNLSSSTYCDDLSIFEGQALKNGYLLCYAAGGNYGYITVINVSNPNSPTIATTRQSSSYMYTPSCGCVIGNYLYVGANGATTKYLSIWNISNPASPTLSTQISFGTNVILHINTFNGFLYVSYGNIIREYSVTNPTAPTLNYTWNTSIGASSFIIQNNYLYVKYIYDPNIVQIIDISNKNSIVSLSIINSDEALNNASNVVIHSVCVDDTKNLLFVSEYYGGYGVLMYDISNKLKPRYVGRMILAGSGPLTLYNNTLYVADNESTGSGWIYAIGVPCYVFSGTTTDTALVRILNKTDYTTFDSYNITAGDYEIGPLFKNQAFDIVAVSSGTGKAIAYGNVIPILKYS